MAKKTKKKAVPDPIVVAAKALKKLLDAESKLKGEQWKKEPNPDKKDVLKLEINLINDIADHLENDIIQPPFTAGAPFKCPGP